MKQKEYIGFESLKQLDLVLNELSVKRIFLVTGRDSYSSCGAENYLAGHLADYAVTRFWDFSSNPKAQDVSKGIELFKEIRPDVVIAVGGGSVVDIAKLVNFFATNSLEPIEYLDASKSNIRKPMPLIAIPTTADSGSEATRSSVLYVGKEKFSVDNEFVLPDVAIVDPALTMSLPKYVTATTGMDALCQAVESYWSINSNDESKKFAKQAIELIMDNLATAVNAPNSSARLAMAKADNLGGKAINITRTTAPHAISYPLTSYFGIAHGHAVGLTLASMLEYNAGVNDKDVLDSRGCKYVQRTLNEVTGFFGQANIADAKETINDLMSNIGLETKLGRLGVKSHRDLDIIIANSDNSDRIINNPRKVTKESLREILEMIY